MFPTILNEMMLTFNPNPFFCCSVKFANAVVLQIAWDCGLQLGLWGEKERGEKKMASGKLGEGRNDAAPSLHHPGRHSAGFINQFFFFSLRFFSLHYSNCRTWSQAILQTSLQAHSFLSLNFFRLKTIS